MSKQNTLRLLLALALILAMAAFYAFDLGRFLSFADLKARQMVLVRYYGEHPLQALLAYAGIYIAVAALSLPGAAIMTLAAGALFGLGVGTVVATIASTIGATCAFLIVRFLLHDAVQSRFSVQLRVINAGIEREGATYLLTLRLIPIFPFFIINIVMALTRLRTGTFALVTFFGMIPAVLVFVNAGTQLARINAPGEILSLRVLGSLALLGIFPIAARKGMALYRKLRSPTDTMD